MGGSCSTRWRNAITNQTVRSRVLLNGESVSQETPSLLRNLKVHYRIQNGPKVQGPL